MMSLPLRILQTLKRIIVLSGVVHLVILAAYGLVKQDFSHMNYFRIIQLDLVFKNVANGLWSHLFSGLIFLCLFGFFFWARFKTRS